MSSNNIHLSQGSIDQKSRQALKDSLLGYHRAEIKVSPNLGSYLGALGEESDSKLIQVLGIIWFHAL